MRSALPQAYAYTRHIAYLLFRYLHRHPHIHIHIHIPISAFRVFSRLSPPTVVWIDVWMDGWMDRRMYISYSIYLYVVGVVE